MQGEMLGKRTIRTSEKITDRWRIARTSCSIGYKETIRVTIKEAEFQGGSMVMRSAYRLAKSRVGQLNWQTGFALSGERMIQLLYVRLKLAW